MQKDLPFFSGATYCYRFFDDIEFKFYAFAVATNDGPDLWRNNDINMTSSPLSTSSRQYMETLKRNYFV